MLKPKGAMRLLFPGALRLALPFFLVTGCGEGAHPLNEAEPVPALQLAATGTVREGAQAAAGVIHPVGHDDLCLDVVWGNNKDGAAVQISKCNGNEAQLWTLVNGMVKVYGDKCLNVSEGLDRNGTRLQIWTCAGDTTQDKNNLWSFKNGTLRWQSHPSMCVDVSSGKFTSGNPVQLWSCGGSTGNVNQRWNVLGKAGSSSPATSPQTPAASATPATPAAPTTPAASSDTGAPTTSASQSVAPLFQAGVHIDYDNAYNNTGGVAGFVKRAQFKPELVANYVRMKKDGSFELGTAKGYADDAANNGAKIISFAVTVEPTTISQTQLQGITDAITYARGKNLAAEVRFGYEMNGYWSPPLYDKNSPSVYKKAWAQVAPVVHKAGGFMVWCPNVAGGAPAAYRSWLPDDLTSIDKVGIDYYLDPTQGQQPTVSQATGIIAGFYPVVQEVNAAHLAAKTGRVVPFTFGETAVIIRGSRGNWGKTVASEVQTKHNWLNALADAGLRQKYPLYKGFTWFDYYKTEQSGGTSGTTYNNSFEISQDAGSASMFRSWWEGLSR